MTLIVRTYLVVVGCQLVQALLDDVVAVQVLDQCHNVQTERNDNSMNLSIVSEISLLLSQCASPCPANKRRVEG